MLDDDGEVVEYFNCPTQFIAPAIWDFWNRTQYLKKYPHTAKPYDERDERYENWHNYFLDWYFKFLEKRKESGISPEEYNRLIGMVI